MEGVISELKVSENENDCCTEDRHTKNDASRALNASIQFYESSLDSNFCEMACDHHHHSNISLYTDCLILFLKLVLLVDKIKFREVWLSAWALALMIFVIAQKDLASGYSAQTRSNGD